jgi:hypothetical protein
MLTIDLMKKALPRQMRTKVDQTFVDKVNLTLSDPNTAEMFRDNIIGYASVLSEGRFKLTDYINAVRYVSYKVMDKTNTAAYIATFPDRYVQYKANGTSDKDIASYITSYNKNKLVQAVYELTLIPTHLLNADIHQKAINHLASLMMNARSEKVQSDSAGLLLTHLKRPEIQKVEIDVAVKENPMMQDMRKLMIDMATVQAKGIDSGHYNAQQIAHQSIIIDAEVIDDI